MGELNAGGAFADSGGHTLDGSVPHITGGEDSGHAGFKQEGISL
jgi:hypothetical protein